MIPEIIFENEELIAINKPHGLLVHRSRIANDATEFALQIVRDYLGKRVYPAHRLDRKTSGVLLFSKSRETNSIVQRLFRDRKVKKMYRAIVRGYMPLSGTIDYALREGIKSKEAITDYNCKQHFEIDVPSGKFPSSRYSLIDIIPLSGRHHQIRKHMAHIFHPIIGDRPHGCNKQNKLWKERFGITTMMLHAESLQFELREEKFIHIKANLSEAFNNGLRMLRNNNTLHSTIID